jgi:ABC-type phosphate transport system permease subunit
VERIEAQQARLVGALILATLVLPLVVAGVTHLLST